MSAFQYVLTCLTLFCLMSSCMSKYTNIFAVRIPGPLEMVDHVAAKYGFINQGQLGSLNGYYSFVHNGIQEYTLEPNKFYENLLLNDSMVQWCQQQVIKKRVKRSVHSEF